MTFRISARALLFASFALAAAATLFWLGSGSAPAAATVAKSRTFVSTKGLDTNTCGPTDPCRTISRALVETSAGGEVVVLDSGGYGPFTVDKSVTVIAVGVYAGITAGSGNAININAGATDKVTLRGLTLNGVGGANGINATSVGHLYLDELNVKNFTSNGILISLAGSASVFISNTASSDNGTGESYNSGAGLFLETSAGTLNATVSNSRFVANSNGLTSKGSRVTVRDSLAADNPSYGFDARGGVLNLERSVSVNNSTGLMACGGTLRASETFVSGNQAGVYQCLSNYDLVSFGNNRVLGNTAFETFSSTVLQK